MALFRRRHTTKAADTVDLVHGTIGRASASMGNPLPETYRGSELVQRYGMWVHRCVQINAQASASVPFRLLVRGRTPVQKAFNGEDTRPLQSRTKALLESSGPIQPGSVAKAAIRGDLSDLEEVDRHASLELLRDINPWTEGYAYRESVYADLQIYGRAFSLLVGPDMGPPAEVWRMLPHRTEVVPDPSDFVREFRYGHGQDEVRYSPDEVLWFRLFDPTNPWGGVGPLEAWLKTIDAAFEIQQFQSWLFKRGGTPDLVVKTPHQMDQKQRRAFRTDWRRMFGRFARREESIAFLSGSAEIERLGQTNRELDFAQSEDAKRDQIGAAFGVPKSFLTTDDVNRANARESRAMHVELTVWPMVQRVEDVLNERLMKRYGEGLILVHDNPIPEDEEQRRAERESKLRSGWSVNELRADEGLESINMPEADIPLIASGLIPLEGIDESRPDPMAPGAMPPGGQGASEDDEDEADEDQTEDEAPEPETAERGFSASQVAALLKAAADEAVPVRARASEDDPPLPPLSMKALVEGERSDAGGDFDGHENKAFEDDLFALFVKFGKSTAANLERQPNERKGGDYIGANADGEAIYADFYFEKADLPPGSDPDLFIVSDGWEDEIFGVARKHLGVVVQRSAEAAIQRLGVEIAFSLANTRAQDYINDVGRKIGRSQTKAITDLLRLTIKNGIEDGISTSEMAKRITDEIGGRRPWAERIARTETAFAHVKAAEFGWQDSGVVVGKRFVLAPDACPFCQEAAAQLDGETKSLGQPFFDMGKRLTAQVTTKDGETKSQTMTLDYAPDGKSLVIPPVHPHCRCDVEPILDDDA